VAGPVLDNQEKLVNQDQNETLACLSYPTCEQTAEQGNRQFRETIKLINPTDIKFRSQVTFNGSQEIASEVLEDIAKELLGAKISLRYGSTAKLDQPTSSSIIDVDGNSRASKNLQVYPFTITVFVHGQKEANHENQEASPENKDSSSMLGINIVYDLPADGGYDSLTVFTSSDAAQRSKMNNHREIKSFIERHRKNEADDKAALLKAK